MHPLLNSRCNFGIIVYNAKSVSVAKSITINRIFSDNHNWDVFSYKHASELRSVEIFEVEKMLGCQSLDSGYFVFVCPDCKVEKVVHLGCGGRVCTHCGKHFTDKWAGQVAENLFNVVHRHCVFSIPDALWGLFREKRELLKELMNCCIVATARTMGKKLGRNVKPGIVAVLHTFGKDMKFYPHVHCLVTEGGAKINGVWVDVTYFPYELLRKFWQYAVLKMLRKKLPKTKENRKWIEFLFKKYGNGFYVYAKDKIKSKKEMVRYIGRYIRHPAIAESRIDSYDGEKVVFHFVNNDGVKKWVAMSVEEFIAAVIGHIPDKHFKVIRYYGVYARQDRKKYKKLVDWSNDYGTIMQMDLTQFLHKLTPTCDMCGNLMEFAWYEPRKPPDEKDFGSRITDWAYFR